MAQPFLRKLRSGQAVRYKSSLRKKAALWAFHFHPLCDIGKHYKNRSSITPPFLQDCNILNFHSTYPKT